MLTRNEIQDRLWSIAGTAGELDEHVQQPTADILAAFEEQQAEIERLRDQYDGAEAGRVLLHQDVERLRKELEQARQMVAAAREGGRIGLAREWQPVAEALTRLEMAFNSTRGNYTKELEDLLDLWATVP